MSIPGLRRTLAEFTSPHLRRIKAEYHLELVAQNTGQIAAQQAELLGLQARAAEANLLAAGELAHRQDETNEILGVGFGALAEGMSRLRETIGDGFENIEASLDGLTDALERGLQMVVEVLGGISEQIRQQQRTLETVVELLRQPYGTQAQELLREASKWLEQGTRRSGRDRDEDWKDAMGLLQEVVSNRIGKQDYLAWFQIGWLQWKHKNDFHAAEESFYQAQRLSASSQPEFHVKSLRHQAYMQDFQGNFEDAYQAIGKARQVSQDHETLYDAARYSAKTNRKEESLRLLDQCIELHPTTIHIMFSEANFQ